MAGFTIYTKEGCIPCQQAKEKFNSFHTEYTEYVIGHDITREEVLIKFPNAKVTPVIVHNETGAMIDFNSLELMLFANKMMEKSNDTNKKI